jgi:hypothetical protein
MKKEKLFNVNSKKWGLGLYYASSKEQAIEICKAQHKPKFFERQKKTITVEEYKGPIA